ncbi:hypothetical protein [Borrelia parkeri]|nr:hypothetical protein [Borrelia parkeri]
MMKKLQMVEAGKLFATANAAKQLAADAVKSVREVTNSDIL